MSELMRVYVPATLAMVAELSRDGVLPHASPTAFALTPALREAYTSGDEDELADAAQREAALASLRLLAAGGSELPPRRVVVAADVPAKARPDLDDAAVRLERPVTLADVAAVMVDGRDAEEAVRKAAAVVDAADLGDEDAELAVGDAEDHSLGWYATQELPFLLELL